MSGQKRHWFAFGIFIELILLWTLKIHFPATDDSELEQNDESRIQDYVM